MAWRGRRLLSPDLLSPAQLHPALISPAQAVGGTLLHLPPPAPATAMPGQWPPPAPEGSLLTPLTSGRPPGTLCSVGG